MTGTLAKLLPGPGLVIKHGPFRTSGGKVLRLRGVLGDDIYAPAFVEQLDELTGRWRVASIMQPIYPRHDPSPPEGMPDSTE